MPATGIILLIFQNQTEDFTLANVYSDAVGFTATVEAHHETML